MTEPIGSIYAPEPATPAMPARAWKRILALFIDSLVLMIIGIPLGFLFGDIFIQMGPYGRLVGLFIAIAYLGLTNSSLNRGQSIGKRCLDIRVLGRNGDFLSPGRSLGRASILCLPYFLNGSTIPFLIQNFLGGMLAGFIVFGLGFGIIYLFFFNRGSRRGLHDLVVGSTVVPANQQDLPDTHLWKGHLVVMGIVTCCLVVIPLTVYTIGAFSSLASVQDTFQALNDRDDVVPYQVQDNVTTFFGGDTHTRVHRLIISVQVTDMEQDPQALSRSLASVAFAKIPNAMSYDEIVVALRYGFDIGIFSKWKTTVYADRPSAWRELIQSQEV